MPDPHRPRQGDDRMIIGTCGCGRQWTGAAEAHCRTCHRHFASVTAFDRHQPARGGCPDPSTLRRGGNPALKVTDRGGGPIWTTWASDESLAAFAARRADARKANARDGGAPRSPEQPQDGLGDRQEKILSPRGVRRDES
jgi:hypothetical protein